MIGVNGWCSANQRMPAGIESVGTNPLPRNGSRSSGIGRLLAVSTLLVTRPSATASQVSANVSSVSRPTAREPLDHAGGRAEAERQRDREDDRHRDQRLDQAADDVAGKHRDAGDRHRPEARDDALGHVHRDRDRHGLGRARHREHEDPGRDVVEVLVAAAGHAGQAGAERVAEHEHEQQQEDERDADGGAGPTG